MELAFSEKEMIAALVNIGYRIAAVDSYILGSEYLNSNHEDTPVKMNVAYRIRELPAKELLIRDSYTIGSQIGVKTVFEKELHERILNLFKA